MKTGSLRLSGLALVAVVLATGCTPEPAAESAGSSEAEQGLADLLPYGREPWPGILTAGQPTKQDFEMLRDRGRLRSVTVGPLGVLFVTTSNGGGTDSILGVVAGP